MLELDRETLAELCSGRVVALSRDMLQVIYADSEIVGIECVINVTALGRRLDGLGCWTSRAQSNGVAIQIGCNRTVVKSDRFDAANANVGFVVSNCPCSPQKVS